MVAPDSLGTVFDTALAAITRNFGWFYLWVLLYFIVTLLYDFSVLDGKGELNMPVTLLTQDGKTTRPALKATEPLDSFVVELTEVAKAIRTGQPSSILNGDLACDALALCEKQTLSVKKQKLVAIRRGD